MTPDVNANFTVTNRPPGTRGWLLMAPLMAWLIAFVVGPTAIMFVYSFCERDDIGQVIFKFTWENYQRIFVPEYFWIIGKSLVAAAVMIGLLLFGLHADDHLGPALREKTIFSPAGLVVFLASVAGYITMREQVFALTTGGNFLKILFRSIELAGLATVICVVIGYPVAYFIGRASETSRNRLLMLVMIPFWTNFLIRTYAWITILKKEGLLNSALKSSTMHFADALQYVNYHGTLDSLIAWIGGHVLQFETLYTPTAVLIGTVYAYLPFMILPIYGSVEKLDNSLVEAAFDLGASPIRAFSNVIVPLTKPGIIAGLLLVFVPAVGMFAINDIIGGKKDLLIGNVIDQQFKQARNMPFGSALGIILLLLFAVAFFFTLRKEKPE